MDKIMINKSLRSIWRNKKSYFSGIFVLAIGLSLFIGMLSGYMVYTESVRLYHAETNFADAFATVRAMPRNSVDRLTRIDGVNQAEGVLKHAVNARLDGFDEIIGVRIVGIDPLRPKTINQFTYIGEPLIESNDIWVSGAFYNVHGLDVGDTIRLLIHGRYENFTIRGIVLSPEYLFVPVVGGGVSDDSLNTLGFVRIDVAENIAGMPGIVTNVSLVLDESVALADVEPFLNTAMERYGLINIVGRINHFSYMVLFQQGQVFVMMSTQFPLLFLSIAIGMLYTTLKRLITMERTEIGTMKAIGFSGRYIVGGYLLQGALAAIMSFMLATVIAWFIGNTFYGLVAEAFDLLWLPFVLNTTVVIGGFFIALIVSVFGVVMGAKASLGVQPAEAMREAAPSPRSVKRGSKFNGWFSKLLLDTGGKLALRSMQRNKKRVVITVVSIGILFTFMNVFFTIDEFMENNLYTIFQEAQISDGTIVLNSPESSSGLIRDIGQMRGVLEVETVLTMPLEFESNGVTRTLGVTGIAADARLFNIFDNDGNQLRTDNGGLILSRFWADVFGLEAGQKVSVDHPNFHTNAYIKVAQIFESATANPAYMEISELSMLFGSETIANSVQINVEEGYLPIIFDQLSDAGNVSGLNSSERMLEFIRINVDTNRAITAIFVIAAIIICFAVVYNISSIALGEKQREYATLRVLGFQSAAVTEINTFEYVVMLILGSIEGIIGSIIMIPIITSAFGFEHNIMDVGLSFMPTLMTFACCALAVAVSCFLTGKQIRKFNLVDVLKER